MFLASKNNEKDRKFINKKYFNLEKIEEEN